MNPKRGYRRGYPVAILAGLEDDRAVLWKVFSNVVKPEKTLWLDGTSNDPKAAYNFHESIINALRPTLKEGVRSVIVASQAKTDLGQRFIGHVCQHHAWLVQGPNRAKFSQTTGSAGTLSEVAALAGSPMFHRLINETTSRETDDLVDALEKCLNTDGQGVVVSYSIEEIEALVTGPRKTENAGTEYLVLTDKYLSKSSEKNRMHRLMQIAVNRDIRTRVVDADSSAGLRLMQLGGIVYFRRGK